MSVNKLNSFGGLLLSFVVVYIFIYIFMFILLKMIGATNTGCFMYSGVVAAMGVIFVYLYSLFCECNMNKNYRIVGPNDY